MNTIAFRRVALFVTTLAAVSVTPVWAAVTKPGDYYVTKNQTEERLAPSPSAKSTNTLYKRQKVTVMELKSGWARVSRYYDGEVEGAKGQVARWVLAKDLDSQIPAEETFAGSNTPLAQALKDSDNFARNKKVFISASEKLVGSGQCKVQDFKDNGGWSKSSNHGGDVYFAYCGGNSRENRIYLDASSGRTFR